MKQRKPTTEGLTWVEYSLIAFNGSGYASRADAESFLNSYIDYNRWRKRSHAVELAHRYYHALLPLAENLFDREVAKQPSSKNWTKWQTFRHQDLSANKLL